MPIPSRVSRSFGMPADRATAHSPLRHDICPEAEPTDPLDDRGHVIGLDRVLPEPRIREGLLELQRGGGDLGQVGQADRRAVAPGGLAQGRGDRRQAVGGAHEPGARFVAVSGSSS